MNLQPTLEDDLIILRPLRSDDFDELYAIAKDPFIWEQHQIKDRYKKIVFTKFFNDSLNSNGSLVVIDKSTNAIIGSTRFKVVETPAHAVEIGWSFLARSCWGGYYNKSMKCLMLDYAFKYVSDVVFYVDKDNIRSQKAVKKIGGKRIIAPHLQHLIKNSLTDWTYRINKQDWDDKRI